MPDPVILELAVNGATPRSRNRHVPRDPGEIAEVALAAVELGASIIHNHNDEPMFTPDGVHAVEPYLASWRPVLHRHPELLMYPTMAAGARGIPVERRWALTWQRSGRLPAGAMVKLYFGGQLEFGLPPTAAGLEAYLELLEPSGLPWSVAVLGGDVVACGLAERAIRRGGHVRVGLEDWAGTGEPSNLDLMRALTDLVERLGRQPATIRDARRIVGISPPTA
jgi:3-keto-5-aminohexanoate cleavage enzyme